VTFCKSANQLKRSECIISLAGEPTNLHSIFILCNLLNGLIRCIATIGADKNTLAFSYVYRREIKYQLMKL
jgi:hypothetical protein